MKDRPKIAAVDLDGTILDSKNSAALGAPIKGIKEKLEKFRSSGYKIIIWTVRKKTPEIVAHLEKHEIPYDYFNENPWQPKGTSQKIKADVYIDDRAVNFSGNPEDYEEAMQHKPWWDVNKAQPGEESGEFRGGDPEDLQQKREEKREEQAESGELEDVADEVDEDDLAEEAEAEAEKEATKSYDGSPINTGSGQVSPVDTWEDYRPTNINGDPIDEMAPIKPIELTAESRPGKNQHKPWSDVTGYTVPLQGQKWVHLRQFTIRGDEEGAMKEQAKIVKAMNHGLTFDPDFYVAFENISKARRGEVVAGHKYVYRWMDESGVWNYKYSDGSHTNHGPGHYGNMQGHSLNVPEGHIASHDPDKKDPKTAFHAAKKHVETHGGVFPSTLNGKEMLMRIHGSAGQEEGKKPRQKTVELVDKEAVHKDQKIPEGESFDHKKHKIKGKFASKKEGGKAFRNLDNLEGTIRREETHTEHDAEDKPLLEWRFGKEAAATKHGKEREKEGRNVSVRHLVDKDHPLWDEGHTTGVSKDGWIDKKFEDIDQLRSYLKKEKAKHAQVLGHTNLTDPLPEMKGKPTVNWIHQGGIKKTTAQRSYDAGGVWDPEGHQKASPEAGLEAIGRWVPAEEGETSKRYKKKRNVLVADLDQDTLNDAVDKLTRKGTGELYPLILHDAVKAADQRLISRTLKGQTDLTKQERRELIGELVEASTAGVIDALNYFDPSHESKATFLTFARYRIRKAQQAAVRDYLAAFGDRMRARGGNVDVAEAEQAKQANQSLARGEVEDSLIDAIDNSDIDKYEPYEGWTQRVSDKLDQSTFLALTTLGPGTPEFKAQHQQVVAAKAALKRLEEIHGGAPPPEKIFEYVNEWNAEGRGGYGFIPEFKSLDEQSLLDKAGEIGKAATSLEDQYGHDRLNAELDYLHEGMQGGNKYPPEDQLNPSTGLPYKGHPYHETEHAQSAIVHPDLKAHIEKHGAKTAGDLLRLVAQKHALDANGNISSGATKNLDRFTQWLQTNEGLDEDYGPTPPRGGEVGGPSEPERAVPSSEKAPTEATSDPSVTKRPKVDKAIQILTKAVDPEATTAALTGQPQEPSPETDPQMFDQQGQKLFQPVPEGAKVEENPEYDSDPAGGNNWSGKYQDPETGSTRYSYLHQDRADNPKLHHNNSMRYLDAQLPKIRGWYKEKIASQQPMERAVGFFLMLMDQAKIRHHDEVEGGLATLRVEQVEPGEGDVITFNISDTYKVNVTLDQQAKAVLQELMEGKEPDDLVFQVEEQALDPETVEQFLQGTFGVDAGSFRTLHSTKQYSKEFQSQTEDGTEDVEQAKEQALESTATSLGHTDGANAVRDHVDPVAQEALHMMVKKSLVTNPETGESMTARGWAKRYAQVLKAYKLQGRIEFQGFQISVENKKGSVRKWYDPHGKESGETKMHFAYGYIRRTKGTDGDHVDVYVGDNEDADTVYVVHQMKKPDFKKFDEDKVMMGFGTAKEAKAAYIKQYNDPKFFGSMTPLSVEEFRHKVLDKKNQGKMIKSHVWQVSAEHPERTDEEELFSQWLHDYPIHEHESRWAKQKEIDEGKKKEPKPVAAGIGVEVKTQEPQAEV